MSEKIKRRKCFQEQWLEDLEFKDWLRKDKSDITKFRCIICSKSLNLSTSGRAALIDHAKGNKHKFELSKATNFFKKELVVLRHLLLLHPLQL